MGDLSESRNEKNEKRRRLEEVGGGPSRTYGEVWRLVLPCHLVKPSLHSTLKDTAYREITDDQF